MSARLWKTAAIAGGISVFAAVLFLAGLVKCLLGTSQPDRYLGFGSGVVLFGCAILAGMLATKMAGERAIVVSAVAGGIFVLGIGLLTLPFGQGVTLGGILYKGVLPVLVSCGVGAVFEKRGSTRYKNHRKAVKHAGKIYKGKR